jgi:tetratricopeptide (TPR) repeat protein
VAPTRIRSGAVALLPIAALIVAFGNAAADEPTAASDEKLKRVMEQARLRAVAVPAPAAGERESAVRTQERSELLRRGETALEQGHVEAALQAFERAASISHAADTEMGLVRTYMQGGEYRRALAFVAHTASAHREVPGGAALYAWLLRIGGQGANALRLLEEARSRFPGDDVLAQAREQLRSPAPLATGALLTPPARLAPHGPSAGLPRSARVTGTALLIDGGRRALVPSSTLEGASSVWVRNGLGHLARGKVERRVAGADVAVLRLDKPLSADAHPGLAERDPFPGSIAYTVEYIESADSIARWPLLSAGFLGAPTKDGTRRRLGIDLPAGPRGGPVFDAAGRLTGIALRGRLGTDELVPVSRLRAAMGEAAIAPPGTSGAQAVSIDQIYEAALRSAVQVIAVR